MNRNNIWIHIAVAAVLITFAAVLGRIDRLRTSLHQTPASMPAVSAPAPPPAKQLEINNEAEVMVKFKPGVSLDSIRSLAAKNHDVVEDRNSEQSRSRLEQSVNRGIGTEERGAITGRQPGR